MDKLIVKAFVEKKEGEDGTLEVAIASSGIVDRYGEIVAPDGWDLKSFKKNPVFLWAHNSHMGEQRPPIGRVAKIWTEGKGKKAKLMFKPQFDMEDDFARDIYRKFKDGYLNAFSVGFKALETDTNKEDVLVYVKSELLEISAVPVPANPEALVSLKDFGVQPVKWRDAKDEDNAEDKDKETIEETPTNKPNGAVDKPKDEPTDKPTEEDKTMKDLHSVFQILHNAVDIALDKIKNDKGGEK